MNKSLAKITSSNARKALAFFKRIRMKQETEPNNHPFHEVTDLVVDPSGRSRARMPHISYQANHGGPDPDPQLLLDSIAQAREINSQPGYNKRPPRVNLRLRRP